MTRHREPVERFFLTVEGETFSVVRASEYDLLEERLDDYLDDYIAVMNEDCAGDEKHCSCVPVLRTELAIMRAELRARYCIGPAHICHNLATARSENKRLRGLLREWFDASDPSIGGSPGSLLERTRAALAGAADQPAAAPQAPIARVSVWACLPPSVTLYAPGLPPGEYDLYCEPEATAPMMRAADNAADQPDERPGPPWLYRCGMHNAWMRDKCGGCGGLRTWTGAADNAAAQPDAAPKPKRAYYETHEPPHCPTCTCWHGPKEDQPDAASTNSPEVSSGLVVPFYYRLQDKRDPYRYMNFDPNAWNFILVPAVPGEGVVGYSAADNSPGITSQENEGHHEI